MRKPKTRLALCRDLAFAVALTAAGLANGAARAAESGADEFDEYCSVCHSVVAGKVKVGPSLNGIVGRKAGSMAGIAYSDALKASGILWTPEALDHWITNPAKLVPGTTMSFQGEADAGAAV